MAEATETIRTFDTGATRDADNGKLDPEGFLSPMVLHRFALYMNRHREQPDGSFRSSDNWQKGIPKKVYLQSLLRHTFDIWLLEREDELEWKQETSEWSQGTDNYQEVLCAILFNAQGLLFESLRADGIELAPGEVF